MNEKKAFTMREGWALSEGLNGKDRQFIQAWKPSDKESVWSSRKPFKRNPTREVDVSLCRALNPRLLLTPKIMRHSLIASGACNLLVYRHGRHKAPEKLRKMQQQIKTQDRHVTPQQYMVNMKWVYGEYYYTMTQMERRWLKAGSGGRSNILSSWGKFWILKNGSDLESWKEWGK